MNPMPLASIRDPFDHPDFIFEVKYDGFRALAHIENRSTRLVSRKGHGYKAFSELSAWIGEHVRVSEAIIDGEIVCLDELGRPQFYDLLFHRRRPYFYAFDMLSLDGRDLRGLPLVERKRQLERIVPAQPSLLLFARHIQYRGTDLFRSVCSMDLEGIVAKHERGTYNPERTSWIKIKNRNYSQAAVRQELFKRKH